MTDYTAGSEYYADSEWGSTEEQFPEWQEFWDENAQAKYWYNSITGEASWTRPAVLGDDQSVTSSVTATAGGADDWVSYIDETTGQEYWFNSVTGESSWA